jgi:hypothetical protein
MALNMRAACRIAGRRFAKPVSGQAVVPVTEAESQRRIVFEHSRIRRFSTCRINGATPLPAVDMRALEPDVSALPDMAPSRLLPLSAQSTAARLAEILELLDGELGGDEEWSRRVETALEELKSSSGRRGRLAGKLPYGDEPS